jgi:carbonic anhydrase/acetyltransferase-like protein (isoleucine patch superfamily)
MPVYSYKGIVPKLGRDVFLAPNATVIGDVVLGDAASIWYGVVVRGDVFPIRIGARTNIQDNSVIHVTNGTWSTTIGDDVTVGHLAMLHGCTVGDRCLIGMSSVVLDGAIVEDECLIGAGSLVPPGAKIPSRSLVMGRPARVIRRLEEADLAGIRKSSALYVEYARDFMESVALV